MTPAPLSRQVRDLLDHPWNVAPSADARGRARLLLLDTLGCAVAGASSAELRALAAETMRGRDGAHRVPGFAVPLDPPAVALLLGPAACWDEACEGLARAHGRPGLHAIPAVLAMGLREGATLGAALDAIVAGYEVGGRLGEVFRIRPGMHVDGTWGGFGAAVGAARAAGCSAAEAMAAVSHAACGVPASLYLPIRRGVMNRNLYVGHAAVRALEAVATVRAGIGVPGDALEECARVLLGLDPAAMTLAPLGESFLSQGYLKPYAGVRHAHYPAAAAIAWRARHGGTEGITALRVETYSEALTYAGNRAPDEGPMASIAAQFSLSWAAAHALRTGGLGAEAFRAAALADPETRRLERLVTLTADPARDASGRRGARLVVTRGDGETEAVADLVPGDAGRPMTEAEVRAKFTDYAAPHLGAAAGRLAEAILGAPPATPLADILGDRR